MADFDHLKSVQADLSGAVGRTSMTFAGMGKDAAAAGKTIKDQFNYKAVSFNAKKLFQQYDEDNSGAIDQDELEELLYDLGVRLTTENLRAAHAALGIHKDTDECKWEAFEPWWEAGYAKDRAVRETLMKSLSKEIRDQYIPHIKAMFAEADVDESGALDPAEFKAFHPKLQKYLGYMLPSADEIMTEIDGQEDAFALHEDNDDGLISYEEFEHWFLELERSRAGHSANGVATIRLKGKVDLGSLKAAFGDAKPAAKPTGGSRKTMKEMFKYEDVVYDARAIFDKFDADNSNTIDAVELEDMMYEMGVRLTPANVKKAKEGLGIGSRYSEVNFAKFKRWFDKCDWIKSGKHKQGQLKKLAAEYREKIVPHIKVLFQKADKDNSGGLDTAEFEAFYPNLREYLGYEIPGSVKCLQEMDSENGHWASGIVEYDEFETWFLNMEEKRMEAALEVSKPPPAAAPVEAAPNPFNGPGGDDAEFAEGDELAGDAEGGAEGGADAPASDELAGFEE